MNTATSAIVLSPIIEIKIPRETVNDDTVTIVKWHHPAGQRLNRGDTILSIETSKTVLEIEAPAGGFLEILFPEGAQVPVGAVAARLLPEPPESIPQIATASHNDLRADTLNSRLRISHKALAMMKKHALDPAIFQNRGMVREKNVEDYLLKKDGQSGGETTGGPSPNIHIDYPEGQSRNGLFHDARKSAQERGRGILWLACNYFFRNYLLGLLVRIAPRGIILWLHRLRGVRMGRGCYIDPTAVVETAYPEMVTLGNDVRIAARAVIMTHIKAPHYLREKGLVPNLLKPVVLEDHCFIGVNAVILPGVRIGKAAVVTSGAVVTCDVPDFTMAAGNPAKVIKHFKKIV